MINILLFAQLREAAGVDAIQMDYKKGMTVEHIKAFLLSYNESLKSSLNDSVLIAVNQEMSQSFTEVNDCDEVAFFPPVTGG